MTEKINLIRTKVKRSYQHIDNLNDAIGRFNNTSPYKFGIKDDPDAGKRHYYLVAVDDTDLQIPLIVGDVVQNLRSALDHLAYQLVLDGTGVTPGRQVYFPIADSAEKFPSSRDSKIQGASPEAKKLIDAAEPYLGGKGEILWKLNRLSITDKHRLLIAAGLPKMRSADLGGYMMRRMMKQLSGTIPEDTDTPRIFYKSVNPVSDRPFPMKTGDIIWSTPINMEVDKNMQFTFEIAFNEPGIFEGDPIVPTLKQMADFVDGVISVFKPLLK